MKIIEKGSIFNAEQELREWEERVQQWIRDQTITTSKEEEGCWYWYPQFDPKGGSRSWLSSRDVEVYGIDFTSLNQSEQVSLPDGMLFERGIRIVQSKACPPHPYGEAPSGESRSIRDMVEEKGFFYHPHDGKRDPQFFPFGSGYRPNEERYCFWEETHRVSTEVEVLSSGRAYQHYKVSYRVFLIFPDEWVLLSEEEDDKELIACSLIHDYPDDGPSVSTSLDVDGFWNK